MAGYHMFWHNGVSKYKELVDRFSRGIHHPTAPQRCTFIAEESVNPLYEALEAMEPGEWTVNPPNLAVHRLDHVVVDNTNPVDGWLLDDELQQYYCVQSPSGIVAADWRCNIWVGDGGGNHVRGDCHAGGRYDIYAGYHCQYTPETYKDGWLIPDLLSWDPNRYRLVYLHDMQADNRWRTLTKAVFLPYVHKALWDMVEGGDGVLSSADLYEIDLEVDRYNSEKTLRDAKKLADDAFSLYKTRLENLNNISNQLPTKEEFQAIKRDTSTIMADLEKWPFIGGPAKRLPNGYQIFTDEVKIGRVKTKIEVSFLDQSVAVAFTNEKVAPRLESPVWATIGRKVQGHRHTIQNYKAVLKCIEDLSEGDIECRAT